MGIRHDWPSLASAAEGGQVDFALAEIRPRDEVVLGESHLFLLDGTGEAADRRLVVGVADRV
jgi:hypothetical protein